LILHGIIRNEVIPSGVEVHIYVSIDVGTFSDKLETYLSCEAWCKNSQLLMGTKNIVYKGKSLHVHRNNKNHISENHNGKHSHCFLIHLNFLKIKSRQIHGLTPKGQSSFFSKNTPKLPFLVQEAQTKKMFFFFCIFNRKILPWTIRRTCAKSFCKS
jgi:hypothetical protein